MKENERRALPALTVRDRVAVDLRELQLCVRHPMSPILSVRANARLIIGPEPKVIAAKVAMSECESPVRGTGEQQPQPTLSNRWTTHRRDQELSQHGQA